MTGKIKAVLFDLDGTTLYTLPDLRDAVNHALEKNGYPVLTEDQVRRFIGNGLRKLVARALPEDSSQETVQKVLEDLEEFYSVHLADGTRPYEGITELLEQLKREGYLTGAVTNKVEPAAVKLMDTFFPGLIDVTVGEREGIPRKPDPAMVEAALVKLGVAADECVYVGDSDVDVRTAKNSGCVQLSVTWGYRSREELTAAGAERFAESPAEIAEIVLNL